MLGLVLLIREIGECAIDRFLFDCFGAFDRLVEETDPVAMNETQCSAILINGI